MSIGTHVQNETFVSADHNCDLDTGLLTSYRRLGDKPKVGSDIHTFDTYDGGCPYSCRSEFTMVSADSMRFVDTMTVLILGCSFPPALTPRFAAC